MAKENDLIATKFFPFWPFQIFSISFEGSKKAFMGFCVHSDQLNFYRSFSYWFFLEKCIYEYLA